MYDTAKCITFTKIVTILNQSVEFLITIMISDPNILAQVLYQDQSIAQTVGDVICPNKQCRGGKCVYLTSLEKINKNTYQCKQCRACSHVLNILGFTQRFTAYGSVLNLAKAAELSPSRVTEFLHSKTSYTGFTQATRKFKRMRAFASFKGEIWCMDLAYVDR